MPAALRRECCCARRTRATGPTEDQHEITPCARPLYSLLVACAFAIPLGAQWNLILSKTLPRTADGKVDLKAAPRRTPDGKMDLSGLWEPPSVEYLAQVRDVSGRGFSRFPAHAR